MFMNLIVHFLKTRRVCLVITSKSLTYTKFFLKLEKLSKMVRDALFGNFCSQYQIVSSKEIFSKKLVTLSEKAPFTCTDSNSRVVIRSKSLIYTKIPLKTEILSKMVRGALFGTFCSQYQIVSSKDTFFLENF